MPTVILGGGIIGCSTAYYLSQAQPDSEIHIIEPSSDLFSAASGYAAGFLAKDWFSPSLETLGELSFDLHAELAAQYGGDEKWGYMKGTAFSLDASVVGSGARGDDWLETGTSRAEAAGGSTGETVAEAPRWLTMQKGTSLDRMSDEDTVAQVDPLRLSRFLLDASLSHGVQLHHPARAISVVTDHDSNIRGIKIIDLNTEQQSTIPCTNLVLCAGPWTPQVFKELFPSGSASIPVSSLAGYSLVVRSPRYTLAQERELYGGRSHAIFTSNPFSCGFSPEIFSRQGGEIYIAGLNSPQLRLPKQAEDSAQLKDKGQMQRLKSVAVRLMGGMAETSQNSTGESLNTDDLEILREGLCFRPVTKYGTPVISRIPQNLLGTHTSTGGVFVAAGHGPWGISLSLGTGKVVAEMVQGVKTSADVSELEI